MAVPDDEDQQTNKQRKAKPHNRGCADLSRSVLRRKGTRLNAVFAITCENDSCRDLRGFARVSGTAQAELVIAKRGLPFLSAEIATQQDMAVTCPKLLFKFTDKALSRGVNSLHWLTRF